MRVRSNFIIMGVFKSEFQVPEVHVEIGANDDQDV